MLIHCPKCGFEQPKDDYCAKCGVHIPSYKIPEPPLKEKAFRSAAFYGVLLLFLAVGSTLYFKSKFTGFESKIEEYNINQLNELVDSDPDATEPEDETEEPESFTSDVVNSVSLKIQEAKIREAGPKALLDTSKERLEWEKYQIYVAFYEASPDLNDPESQIEFRQESPDYQVFKHTYGENVFFQFTRLAEYTTDFKQNNISIQSGNEQNNLDTQIRWNEENHRALIELLLSYNLQFEDNIASGISFSDYLKPGQFILIKGILPRANINTANNSLPEVLNIYNSEAFSSGDSDFYIQLSIREQK